MNTNIFRFSSFNILQQYITSSKNERVLCDKSFEFHDALIIQEHGFFDILWAFIYPTQGDLAHRILSFTEGEGRHETCVLKVEVEQIFTKTAF